MKAIRTVLLLALVAGGLRAQSRPSPAVELAEGFLHAWRKEDRSAQAILAARPARTVSYTLAVQELLDRGEVPVAAALAEQRGGPEHAGLQRLVEVWQSGQRPTPDQGAALLAAGRALEEGRAAHALELLASAGEPIPGTLFGVRILWTRGHAMRGAERTGEAVDAFLRCSDLALEIGWLQQARDAADAALRTGGEPDARARRAADRIVESTRKLQDDERLLADLVRRSAVLRALDLRQEARADIVEAIALAQSLGRKLEEAQLQGNLALMLQMEEGQPRASLRHHEEAVRLLRGLDHPDALVQALFNLSTARTATAGYVGALEALDEALDVVRESGKGDRARLLAQRGYVQRRMGLLRSSLADYDAALAEEPPAGARLAIELDLADLQLERGDLDAAEAIYLRVLAGAPAEARALAGRAFCRGARGDEPGARAGFAAAFEAAGSDVERARLLLPLAALERGWGDLGGALDDARRVLKLFLDHPGEDHGNTAVAYSLLGDVLLLGGRTEEALDVLARASVYFQRLRDPARAVPAYAREALALYRAGQGQSAVERAAWLRELAKATGRPAHESVAAVVDAVLTRGAGLEERSDAHLAQALERAREAGDPVREATVLVTRAFLDPERAAADIPAAFALLDARRVADIEKQPVLPGEHPWHAAAIGIASLLQASTVDEETRTALLLPWIERERAEQVRLGLGGREALLHATLPAELHDAWTAVRAALIEARATGEGIPDAEQAFDAVVARVRAERPGIAALAFPAPVDLAQVRAALAADEALLLYHDGPFGRTLLFVDAEAVEALAYDPQRPLDAAAPLLEGKRLLLVSPDGPLAAVSFEAAPYLESTAGERFAIAHVPSAAWLLRQRAAAPGDARGWARAPQEARAHLTYGRVTVGESHALGVLAARGAAPPVVVSGLRVVPGEAPRIGALATLVEALSRAGAGPVLLSLDGGEPLAPATGQGSPAPEEAWRRAVAAARAAPVEGVPSWARAVLYAAR